MSAKHTPGPWTYNGITGYIEGEEKEWTRIANIIPHIHSSITDTANAYLIAAAPELLESLQAVMREEAKGGVSHISEATYEKARAAIQRATGRQI